MSEGRGVALTYKHGTAAAQAWDDDMENFHMALSRCCAKLTKALRA